MPENINADLGELSSYSGKAGGSAQEVSSIAGQHLANQQIGADMLGDLGEESGLHAQLQSAISALHQTAQTSSSYIESLGQAVQGAHSDYVADEQLHADSFRRLERD